MKRISNLTIQRKLLVIFVGTCLTVLILAGGATIAWSQYTFRQNKVRDLVVQTQMASDNCRVAAGFFSVTTSTTLH